MKKNTLAYKPLTKTLSRKAKLLELAGEETRIRILCVLFDRRNICVSDISSCLRMSVAAVSHHLQLLQKYDVVHTERHGKKICYTLNQNPLINYIRQLVCHKE